MSITVDLREKIDSKAPSVVGFSPEGGFARSVYICSTDNLTDTIEALLGYTESRVSDGRLTRHLPLAHPRYPWLFASRIENIQGMGLPTKVASSSAVEADAVDFGTSYPQYELTVAFTPRPYSVLEDSSISVGQKTWTIEDGTTQTDDYAEEWNRFTDIEYNGSVELIEAQQGQMALRRNDANAPNGYTFPGKPTIRMPRAVVTVRWYQVPYRYVSSEDSYIQKYQGRINQTQWGPHAAGSLLYDSYKAKRYTPLFPDTEQLETGGLAFTAEKFCDIEFTFLKVIRTTPSAPTPANANWIAGGHNLLPWFGDRKFYYATAFDPASVNDTSEWYPTYLSFPFELLFTDPDF